MIYILDIETRPNEEFRSLFAKDIKAPGNYKDPAKIQQYVAIERKKIDKKMAVDTDFCDVFCVGIKPLDEAPRIVTLKELGTMLNGTTGFKLVTFNGKHFDLPIIIKHGIKQGIDLPYGLLMGMTKRYGDCGHVDLMEVLGFGEMKSMDKYLQIYCGIGKEEIDFSNVSDGELRVHCLNDLELTEKLYRKFEALT